MANETKIQHWLDDAEFELESGLTVPEAALDAIARWAIDLVDQDQKPHPKKE